MCGILGSVNFDNTSDYLDLIQHRGPDASGIKSFIIGEHSVSLLHRRLSIVDLSEAGNQPMPDCDNIGHIIFNGEIYNHLEIKKKLLQVPFKGHSDTETIVNYLRHFPILENLSNLNGIFAFSKVHRDKEGLPILMYFY